MLGVRVSEVTFGRDLFSYKGELSFQGEYGEEMPLVKVFDAQGWCF